MRQLLIKTIAGAALIAFSVGCGKMSSSGSSSGVTSASVSPSPTPTPAPSSSDVVKQTNADVADYDASNAALLTQVANLNTQLGAITISNLQTGGSGTSNSLSSTVGTLLNGVYTGVSALYTKVNGLETTIQTRIAGLDLSTPEGLAAAAALQGALTYIQQAKAKLNPLVLTLVTKMQSLTGTVDADIAKLSPTNPLTWVAQVYWSQIKLVFTDYEAKLTALTQ